MRVRPLLLVPLLAASPAHADFADHFAVDDDVGVTKVPRFGHTKVLVIRVDIDGANDWSREEAYFSPDWDERDGFGPYTFRRYWQNVSAGRFDPEAVLPDPLDYAACPAPDGDCAFGINFEDMYRTVEVLVDDLRARDGLDLSDFDLSGPDGVPDGVADGVLVLIDPGDMEIGLIAGVSGIAGSSEVFVGGPPFERDGVVVNLWAYVNTLETNVGIAAHEFGHQIGYADSYFPGWRLQLSLMNACAWCSLDAHARVLAGWADVVYLTEPGAVEIEAAFETGKVYRTGGEAEFWLVENRQEVRVGGGSWDRTFGGLAIYHCDESLPFPQWAFPPASYDPYHALTVNLWSAEEVYFFHPGDALLPAESHAPPSDGNEYRTDSNRFDGTRSGFAVEDIEDLGVTPGHLLPSLQARITPAEGTWVPVDGGPADAGGEDAGPEEDAGGDGGTTRRPEDGGCGCGQAGAPGGGMLLALLGLVRARARGRGPA